MDTRVEITRKQFENLTGKELEWALIKSSIVQARGQNFQKKEEVYSRLTPGQKSLFAFWIIYGHTQSGWLQFFLMGYSHFLPVVKKGLCFFDEQDMLENLNQAEKIYIENEKFLKFVQALMEKHADPDPETLLMLENVQNQFDLADQSLAFLLEKTIRKIETYVRSSPEEFVVFVS